ncbi:MAG: TIGR03663 family protein [Proteobacteria bacterium]|nr:TIGR03663 family protein [Pseudomonadota bacterium]
MALDARPVHHDESLHMMYGRYFYDFPDIQYYKYDPMLHGPFLYNALRLVYSTLGSSTEAARAFPALLGSLLIFLPLLFRRYVSRSALLFLTAAIALSPTLTYWSRFIREDIPVLSALAILLYGCTVAKSQHRWLLGSIAFTIQICIKENVFVTAALLVGYLVYEFLLYRVVHRDADTLARRMWQNLCAYPWHAVIGLAISAGIYCYLFSAGFRYWQGTIDFFTRSVSYWAEQHGIERIKGPFNFHLYVLSWYELPFMIAFIAALVRFYRQGGNAVRIVGGCTLVVALGATIAFWNKPVDGVFPWSLAKLKDALDIFGLLVITPHAVLLTSDHLLKKERALGFWGYLFLASLFTYSYLGEKVPWLAVYAFVPGMIYLILLFDQHYGRSPITSWAAYPAERILSVCGIILGSLGLIFSLSEGLNGSTIFMIALAAPLFAASFLARIQNLLGKINLAYLGMVVFCLYSLRANILTNFVYAGQAREYLSQVHTTPEFHDLVLSIRKEIRNQIRGYKPLVYATGDTVWPITWYLVDIPEYKFIANAEERKNFKYQFIDYTQDSSKIPDGFRATTVNLRGWWVPDFSKMTLRNFLNYSLNHTPWSDTGFTSVTFLVRKDEPR